MTDREARVAPKPPRPAARKYLTQTAERILTDCYPGQVRAVVVERALREMAIRDGLLTPKTRKPRPLRKRDEASP